MWLKEYANLYTLQVEYINMSQSINEMGKILKEHCEQSNKVYQNSVVEKEEESKNIITSQVYLANYKRHVYINILFSFHIVF